MTRDYSKTLGYYEGQCGVSTPQTQEQTTPSTTCLTCSKPLVNRKKFCSNRCYWDSKKGKPAWNKGKKGLFIGVNRHEPGEKITYGAYHKYVNARRGKPSKCEGCGTTTATRYEWASISKNYDDIYDYKRLCVPCHRKFDGFTGNKIKWKWKGTRLPERSCLTCGKKFKPNAAKQQRCGSKAKKIGCAFKWFQNYYKRHKQL